MENLPDNILAHLKKIFFKILRLSYLYSQQGAWAHDPEEIKCLRHSSLVSYIREGTEGLLKKEGESNIMGTMLQKYKLLPDHYQDLGDLIKWMVSKAEQCTLVLSLKFQLQRKRDAYHKAVQGWIGEVKTGIRKNSWRLLTLSQWELIN